MFSESFWQGFYFLCKLRVFNPQVSDAVNWLIFSVQCLRPNRGIFCEIPLYPLAAPPKAVFDCPPPSFGLNAPALICSGQSSASPNILVWRANLAQLSALCEGAVWCTCLLFGKVMVWVLGYFRNILNFCFYTETWVFSESSWHRFIVLYWNVYSFWNFLTSFGGF